MCLGTEFVFICLLCYLVCQFEDSQIYIITIIYLSNSSHILSALSLELLEVYIRSSHFDVSNSHSFVFHLLITLSSLLG